MFDLNSTINQWRATLGSRGNIQTSNLDELEDHLRQEIRVLKKGPLNTEEAFLIASRRLGSPEDLNGEFALADPSQRRLFRLGWMITGALAMILLGLAADILANISIGALGFFPAGLSHTAGQYGLRWFFGIIKICSLGLGGFLIWRLLATDSTSRRLRKMTGKIVIAGSFLLALLAFVARTGSEVFLTGKLTSDSYMNVAITNAWFNQILMLILPAILLVSLWRLVRNKSVG